MKKVSVLIVFILICTLSIYAQNKVIAVSGRVIESDTKLPAALVTVQLLTLPDSTYAAGNATDNKGAFILPKVKAGKYVLKISSIGFSTKLMPVQLTTSVPSKNLGTIQLQPDAIMLSEAVITAEAPQVTVVEDTLMYNASAYRTPEGAMLEELVKKLPGAEIDENGMVKINGKEVKKIMVNGKEFFGGDVKTGLKNLPVNMIDKLKTYDKKSDLARITGIDDGEEETVLDLKVKRGMNEGWFGNADAAAGNKSRYASNIMLNRFVDDSQFSLVSGANNVNDQGFSGGLGPRWRQNSGLNASKTLGVNFATVGSKLELGGSARYNFRDGDVITRNFSRILSSNSGKSSFSNSNNNNRNKATDFNADFRLEWKPDTLTNIIFRPNLSFGRSNGFSDIKSGVFNSDPYSLVTNPNDYLDPESISDDDPLRDIRVNTLSRMNLSESEKLSGDVSLQINRKLSNKGRNITFRGAFGFGNNDNDQYSQSIAKYYQIGNNQKDSTNRYYYSTPTKNYNYTAQLTYSEPIAKATFLQFSYQFQYRFSESDKSAFDLLPFNDWVFGQDAPKGYENNEIDSLGRYAEYRYYNHDISTSLRFIREKYQLSAGISLQPQNSALSYKKGTIMGDTTRTVFNFSPNIDLRYRFSKVSQLRFTYRGRGSQPSMENLLPITDNSNPLEIRKGNPGLKPSFTHSLRLFYNTYNPDLQRGIMGHASFNAIQNSISNSTIYDEQIGRKTITPQNINGNWNAFAMFGFNTALKNKKYTINSFSRMNYQNNVGYIYNNTLKKDFRNTATNLSLSENLTGAYRNEWLELGLNGAFDYAWERSKLAPLMNQQPYSFSFGVSTTVTLPWQMTISTNIANNSRRGYRVPSMNRNEIIWNAQLSQSLLKGAGTISFELYDILKQQTNISRSSTDNVGGFSEINNLNTVNNYFMLRFTYRLNVFGNKSAREGMGRRDGFGHQDRPGSRGSGRNMHMPH